MGEDESIIMAEVSKKVKKLLGGWQGPGVDKLCLEMLKTLVVVELSWLTYLFNVTMHVEWQTRKSIVESHFLLSLQKFTLGSGKEGSN